MVGKAFFLIGYDSIEVLQLVLRVAYFLDVRIRFNEFLVAVLVVSYFSREILHDVLIEL